MNGSEEEGNSPFDQNVLKEVLHMLAIPRADAKAILERYVGNVTESFWKNNHIGDVEREDLHRNVEDEEEQLADFVDVDDVDPDSIELDM